MTNIAALRDHLAEARRIMEHKGGVGAFAWDQTAAGQLLLGLEAFFGPRPREDTYPLTPNEHASIERIRASFGLPPRPTDEAPTPQE